MYDDNDQPYTIHCPLSATANIPILQVTRPTTKAALLSVMHETNRNLTGAQKQLLLDHQRLGHLNFAHLQQLYRKTDKVKAYKDSVHSKYLPTRHAKIKSCQVPICLACQLSKQKKRPTQAKTQQHPQHRQQLLSRNKVKAGDRVSLDHFESATRGRLPHTRGREAPHEQYCGGTVFYDHASHLIKAYPQSSLAAHDTLQSKAKFEREADEHNVRIKNYQSDNGTFTAQTFQAELLLSRQTAQRSASGAHHQNGSAERAIQTMSYRT